MADDTNVSDGLGQVKQELILLDGAGGLVRIKQEPCVKDEEELTVSDDGEEEMKKIVPDKDAERSSRKGAENNCNEGEKSCPTSHNLTTQMINNSNLVPHQCPYCDYKSVISASMKKHIMICHTNEKPHTCPHCDLKCVGSHYLKKHIMARHTGRKPHQCSHCDYKSLRPANMKRHIMLHHTGEKSHQCPHCDYKSGLSQHLKRHLMLRHSN